MLPTFVCWAWWVQQILLVPPLLSQLLALAPCNSGSIKISELEDAFSVPLSLVTFHVEF